MNGGKKALEEGGVVGEKQQGNEVCAVLSSNVSASYLAKTSLRKSEVVWVRGAAEVRPRSRSFCHSICIIYLRSESLLKGACLTFRVEESKSCFFQVRPVSWLTTVIL